MARKRYRFVVDGKKLRRAREGIDLTISQVTRELYAEHGVTLDDQSLRNYEAEKNAMPMWAGVLLCDLYGIKRHMDLVRRVKDD